MSKEQDKNIDRQENAEENEIINEGKIFIKNIAFKKMLSHVLRFGSESLEDKQEVLGACLGKFNPDNNTLELEDVIPVTHGDIVELGFSQEVHEVFKDIDKEYQPQNLRVIGYYLSHTGYGLILSKSDKKNLEYVQNEQNPFGFGLIFDSTLIGKIENFGFQVYRLKSYSKGIESAPIKVAFEIEKPKTLDYFEWIKDFIEDSQKKSPIIIKEFDEMKKPLPEELQEIPLTERELIEDDFKNFNSQVAPIFSGFQEGTNKFSNLFIETYKKQLNNWMWDITKGTLKGTEHIRSTITQMKNTILKGLEDVQSYFERSFNEISDVFIKDVSEYMDNRINNQKAMKRNLKEKLSKMTETSQKILEENINQIINKLEKNEISIDKQLSSIVQIYDKIEPQLKNITEKLSNVYNETNLLSEDLLKDTETLATRFETKLKMEIDNLNLNSDPIQEKYKQIESLIERLQRVISDFRQLK